MEKLKIVTGDITSDELLQNHDIIVNPTNPRMVCGAGVSGAIFHKAGVEELESYTQKNYAISYFTEDNLMEVGQMRITPGFALGIDIMFAQGPKFYDYAPDVAQKLLLTTYENIIKTAIEHGYKRILCPSLGTGSYGFTHEDTAKSVVSSLNEALKDTNIEFTLVLYDERDLKYYS